MKMLEKLIALCHNFIQVHLKFGSYQLRMIQLVVLDGQWNMITSCPPFLLIQTGQSLFQLIMVDGRLYDDILTFLCWLSKQ
jgi:hypothetical protein